RACESGIEDDEKADQHELATYGVHLGVCLRTGRGAYGRSEQHPCRKRRLDDDMLIAYGEVTSRGGRRLGADKQCHARRGQRSLRTVLVTGIRWSRFGRELFVVDTRRIGGRCLIAGGGSWLAATFV